MIIRYETDTAHLVKLWDLPGGTPFQFKDSSVLFMKLDGSRILELKHGRVCDMGTHNEFTYVNPRYDAVVVFERQ